MKKPQMHKGTEGFTLIEMLIAIAIIGILASVAIPQYSQYKIRGYDAQTKQALKNMHLLCNAYWLDTSVLQGCDLSKIKEPTYGFNQNADVVATLPPSPLDNFCASAKHNDSPNTFSIDSAALISSGSGCAGSSGTVQTASTDGSVKTASVSAAQAFEDYEPCEGMGANPEYQRDTSEGGAGTGVWMWVDSDGNQIIGSGAHRVAGPCLWNTAENDSRSDQGYKRVFISPPPPGGWSSMTGEYIGVRGDKCAAGDNGASAGGCTYDFETQTYLDEDGNRWATDEYNTRVE